MSAELLYNNKKVAEERRGESAQIADTAARYAEFLTCCKTERACVRYFEQKAKEHGFLPLDFSKPLRCGDKFYAINRNKSIFIGIMGEDIERDGIHISAAHIDAPRLDLKPQPLYEDDGLALLKTHYYGGIKKYQWTAIPLSLEGVVITREGRTVDISGGGYTFCISDLLPHLAADQMQKTAAKVVEGEDLRAICGTVADTDEDASDRVKLAVLKILNERYGITERELISAELSLVPKYPAELIGFDKSIIGAYGHDDRICAWTAFEALVTAKPSRRTVLLALVDKEETGSDGVTGMQGQFFEMLVEKLCEGKNMRMALYNSKCLSADVNAAFDPIYPSVLDRQNASVLGCGPTVTKYTGARGKSGTSDASAETMAYFTNLFDDNGIIWQSGLLGKIDVGGGGTVAKYMANRNIDTVDIGVGLLSMHAPYEMAAAADVYETVNAFRVFMED